MRPEGVVVNRILGSEREREKPLFENWEDLCSPDGDAVAGPDTQRGMGTRFTVGANYRASRALANLPRDPPDDKAASVHQTMELILVKPPLVPMATSNTPNLDAGGAFIRKCRERRGSSIPNLFLLAGRRTMPSERQGRKRGEEEI
ncbi:hypothetical protein NPIL_549341 [Nephila pilipes]|uniref:Uncharacterized protein n=1 Tax=Nephila pilipes TaxID=299642 RepID=A0A8X6UEJ8_NEPPI|nr:hypothetical protein NPIL_549341 [Nephila pilipes]